MRGEHSVSLNSSVDGELKHRTYVGLGIRNKTNPQIYPVLKLESRKMEDIKEEIANKAKGRRNGRKKRRRQSARVALELLIGHYRRVILRIELKLFLKSYAELTEAAALWDLGLWKGADYFRENRIKHSGTERLKWSAFIRGAGLVIGKLVGRDLVFLNRSLGHCRSKMCLSCVSFLAKIQERKKRMGERLFGSTSQKLSSV